MYVPMHYRKDPLNQKEAVEQATPVKPAYIPPIIFYPKLLNTNMGMNAGSLILPRGHQPSKLPVPSACIYSETLSKLNVAISIVKPAFDRLKLPSNNVQSVKRQTFPHFHMKA